MSAVYPMPPVWPTVVHMLADAALQDPDGPALVCGNEALCYRQYAACVSGLAWQLQRDGLGEGDRVVVFMANSPDVATALFVVQAAGMPNETAQALRDGWLYTGDIGRLDEDGYLFICDRKKEMVIVSGFNVYPREIEEALYCHPAVREVAVIGAPDSYRGEILQAYVVVADEKVGASDLQGFLMQRLAKYKWPAHIYMVNDLPRTSIGKIDKKRLRTMAANS